MKMSERKKKELILNRESQQFLSMPCYSIYQELQDSQYIQ